MANRYVYSGAAGAADGTSWTDAYTTLGAAATAMAVGDVIYVADDHAETNTTALILTPQGSLASPSYIICVRRSGGSVPPVLADLRTTAQVTRTGGSGTIAIGGHPNGSCIYYYGIIFSAGSGVSAAGLAINGGATNTYMHFKNCQFKKPGTSATATAVDIVNGNAVVQSVVWDGCSVTFGASGDGMRVQNTRFIWRNSTAISGGTAPNTALFGSSQTAPSIILLDGVDLSGVGSSCDLFDNSVMGRIVVQNCKLPSGTGWEATPSSIPRGDRIFIRCANGDTQYNFDQFSYAGRLTTSTAVYRTGGATDGVTRYSWKIDTTAHAEWEFPFTSLPIHVWNDLTGSSKTLTIEGIWGGGAVPNNDEIWIEVYYPGTSGSTLYSMVSSNKANILASAAAVASASETWSGSTTDFKLQVTFTPQERGPILVYVKAAKVSSTFYIDPVATLS